MQGRKILRPTHISASHLSALFPLPGNKYGIMPIHPQGRVHIAPLGRLPQRESGETGNTCQAGINRRRLFRTTGCDASRHGAAGVIVVPCGREHLTASVESTVALNAIQNSRWEGRNGLRNAALLSPGGPNYVARDGRDGGCTCGHGSTRFCGQWQCCRRCRQAVCPAGRSSDCRRMIVWSAISW